MESSELLTPVKTPTFSGLCGAEEAELSPSCLKRQSWRHLYRHIECKYIALFFAFNESRQLMIDIPSL